MYAFKFISLPRLFFLFFSVFYRQFSHNSLGNLPSGLFSNLGNLTELYVEICIYICSFILAKGKGLNNSLVGGGTQDKVRVLPYDFTLTRACNRRNPEQGKGLDNSLVGGGIQDKL